MATLVNPYQDLAQLETSLMEDVAMKDTHSQTRSESTTSGSGTVDPPLGSSKEVQGSGSNKERDKNIVNFKDPEFMLPPSFSREISAETLHNDKRPFIFWATLKIPLPENLGNAANTMFNCLADFIEAMGEEDKHFTSYHI